MEKVSTVEAHRVNFQFYSFLIYLNPLLSSRWLSLRNEFPKPFRSWWTWIVCLATPTITERIYLEQNDWVQEPTVQ